MELESLISVDERETIRSVFSSPDWSFANLVALTKLDPRKDFRFSDFSDLDLRGQDLRGFDFTGSDLRRCLIDKTTQIDETTILAGCDLEWIEQERVPIHEKMFQVEVAKNSAARRAALSELITQYTSPRHTRIYLRQLLEKVNSVDALFDILDFFQVENSEDRNAASEVITKFLLRSARRKSNQSSGRFSAVSFSNFLGRLSECSNSFVQDVFADYLSDSLDHGRVTLNPTKYEVSDDLRRLINAFEVGGKDQPEL